MTGMGMVMFREAPVVSRPPNSSPQLKVKSGAVNLIWLARGCHSYGSVGRTLGSLISAWRALTALLLNIRILVFSALACIG
ncbi:hypothetical protein M378DRAFT_855228 [Amanita muscaria Koide BX008]|uniref:Uncharacterized protein n=1 Tax=Amanita muscaria (strain Koide BX008) TaxID=946122 RepID=A0A0C2WIS3_AMAMK|nr:hypothetical protein M378DRAFT_855228 [Amanita muscaria Koide BX008]